jgi:hypothetical protein
MEGEQNPLKLNTEMSSPFRFVGAPPALGPLQSTESRYCRAAERSNSGRPGTVSMG